MFGGSLNTYFEISPGQKKGKSHNISEEPPSVLRLLPFTHSPKLSFGNVKLGETKRKILLILNPKDVPQELYCEKFPSCNDGLQFSFLNTSIAPGETVELLISWTPKAEGDIRELIHWRTSIGVRSQTIILGACIQPKSKQKSNVKGFKTKPQKLLLRPQNSATNFRNSKTEQEKSVVSKKNMISRSHSENIAPQSLSRVPENEENNIGLNQIYAKSILTVTSTDNLKMIKRKEKCNRVDFSENVEVRNFDNQSTEVFVDAVESCLDSPQPLSDKSNDFSNYSRNPDSKHSRTAEYFYSGPQNISLGRNEFDFMLNTYTPRRETYIKSTGDNYHANTGFQKISQDSSCSSYIHSTYLVKDDVTTGKVQNYEEFSDFSFETLTLANLNKEKLNAYNNDDKSHNGFTPEQSNFNNEVFGDARKGIMQCNIAESPLRRQTYVKKRSWEDEESGLIQNLNQVEGSPEEGMQESTIPTASPANLDTEVTLPEDFVDFSFNMVTPEVSKNTKKQIDSCHKFLKKLDCMFNSSFSQGSSTQMPTVSFEKVDNEAALTIQFDKYRKLSENSPKITDHLEVCRELLDHLDSVVDSPISADSSSKIKEKYTEISNDYCNIPLSHRDTSKLTDNYAFHSSDLPLLSDKWINDVILSGQSSPVQEFVTAPSTPVESKDYTLIEEFADSDCDKTQEFPTPNIDPMKLSQNGDLSTPSMQTLGVSNNENCSLSTDSLERSNIDNCFGPLEFSNTEQGHGDEVDQYSSLSNGTVIVETSILHPNDIINIDNIDMSSAKRTRNPIDALCFDHSPIDDASPEIETNEFDQILSNNIKEGCNLDPQLSLVQSPITQLFKPLKNNGASTSTPNHFDNEKIRTPLVFQRSETLGSLSDFSFIPGEDLQRCSTITKAPKHVVPSIEVGSKKRLFDMNIDTFNLESNNEAHKILNTNTMQNMTLSYIPESDDIMIAKDEHLEPLSSTFDINSTLKIHDGPFVVPKLPDQRKILKSSKQEDSTNRGGLAFKISPPMKKNQSTHSVAMKYVPEPRRVPRISVASLKQASKAKRKFANISLVKGNIIKENAEEKFKVSKNDITQIEKLSPKETLTTCFVSNATSKDKSMNASVLSDVSDFQTKRSLRLSSSSAIHGSVKDMRRPVIKKKQQLVSRSRLMPNKRSKFQATNHHHPNPFAATNMYYDDRWVEKQISGFQKWLNFVLTPSDEENQLNCNKKVDISKLWMEANRCSSMQKAPSREAMSLKSYSARRRLGKLRRAACKLYQSHEMAKVITKLEVSIGKKLLTIRKDRQSHADLGLKQEMLKLTLCYNPLWLRIGLETVYGEVIHLVSNNDISGLTFFIITRLLSCPDIAKKYAHPTVPFSYKQGYEEALKTFQLKKFLVLIFFLDKAKESRLIDHDPCLFNKEAEFKSSRDVLIAFAREFLSGVGDITKHLAYMGYMVNQKQTLLDEFDFAVTNVAADLRCGIRMTRVAEILLQDYSLCSRLRLPVVSRLQKIHNTEIALKAFKGAGVITSNKEDYSARDIVEGHRENTLAMIWDIILNLQIKNILSVPQLLNEIRHVRKTLLVKSYNDQVAKKGLIALKEHAKDIGNGSDDDHPSTEFILELLKLWIQLVCAHYGLQIDNLTVSFCDGRAFCLILHHYHPNIIKRQEIHFQTSVSVPSPVRNLDVSADDSFSNESYLTDEEYAQRLTNDKANFNLLFIKLNELGGVPILIKPSDMINTIPDEKLTTTFLAYLCARLLNLSTEIQAARVIQLAWRKKLAIIKMDRLKKQTYAAKKIQSWWRNILLKKNAVKYFHAAIILQTHWRRLRAQHLLLTLKQKKDLVIKNKNASIIQSCVRQFLIRRRSVKEKASIQIQKTWKIFLQRRYYLKEKSAAMTIQYSYPFNVAKKKFMRARNSAICIQKWWRDILKERAITEEICFRNFHAQKIQLAWKKYKARKYLLASRRAAVVIQAGVRGWICRKAFEQQMNHVIALQRRFSATLLMRRIREDYLKKLDAVIKIQRIWKTCHIRAGFLEMKRCAIIIQSAFKAKKARERYLKLSSVTKMIQQRWREKQEYKKTQNNYQSIRRSAIIIQTHYRGWSTRKKYEEDCYKIILVQSQVRKYVCRSHYLRVREATLTLQSHFRYWRLMNETRNKFIDLRNAAVVLQSHFRSYLCEKAFRQKSGSCLIIQKYWRGYLGRKKLFVMKWSVSILEVHMSAYLEMKKTREIFCQVKEAAICLQKHWRGYLNRMVIKKTISVIVIQSCVRGYFAQKKYQTLKKSCLIIQKNLRMMREVRGYKIQREAAIVIQRAYLQFKIKLFIERNINEAALRIQSYWKMILQRRQYLNTLNAVRVIQESIRAFLLGSTLRKKFEHQKRACIMLQAFYRMVLARKEYRRKHEAVLLIQKWWQAIAYGRDVHSEYHNLRKSSLVIQSYFQMWKARNQYKLILSSIQLIQAKIRATLQMKAEREEFLKQKRASVVIQSKFRCHMIQMDFMRRKEACLKIQTWFRQIFAENRYLRLKAATAVLQQHFKVYFRQKALENQRKNAAVTIQKMWKMLVTRKDYQAKKENILVLQKHFRMWISRKKYMKFVSSAIVLQTQLRAFNAMKTERQHFVNQKHAAIVIQKYFRGYTSKNGYNCIRSACLLIQSSWRMVLEKNRYECLRQATIAIQAAFRSYLTRKDLKRKSAISVQAAYRGYRDRNIYLRKYNAVIVIQSSFRNYVVARTRRQNYMALRNAALLIQSYVRGHKIRKCIKNQDQAAIKIQSFYRMWIARKNFVKKLEAACILQEYWRAIMLMRRKQNSYRIMRGAVIVIQATWRGNQIRRSLEVQNGAAISIQAFYKGSKERQNYLYIQSKVIAIQKWWCSRLLTRQIQETYLQKKTAVTVIQKFFRDCLAKNKEKLAKANIAAYTLQSFWRRYKSRSEYIIKREAIICIQKWWRRELFKKQTKEQYLREKEAAIMIQRTFRKYFIKQNERMAVEYSAATTLQSFWKMHYVRSKFLEEKTAAAIIQFWWRRELLTWQIRENYVKKKLATITIQRFFSNRLIQKESAVKRDAASIIQSYWKMFHTRSQYLQVKEASICIQRWWRSCAQTKVIRYNYLYLQGCIIMIQARARGHLVRKTYQTMKIDYLVNKTKKKQDALNIENWWIGIKTRREFLRKKNAVMKLQHYWRGSLKTLIAREYFIYLRRATIILQSAWRVKVARKQYKRSLAAITIQRCFRKWSRNKKNKERKKQELLYKAATKIACQWRGYLVRKALSDNRRMTHIRGRLLVANAQACKSEQIGNKTDFATHILVHEKNLKRKLFAVMTLDTCTKLSSVCCEKLIRCQGLEALMFLLRNLNRSFPHMQIMNYVLSNLITLSKYPVAYPEIQKIPDLAPVLIHLMKVYHEKGAGIFLKCATLLFIISSDCRVQGLTMKNLKDDLNSLETTIKRKLKIQASKKGSSVRSCNCPSLSPEWSMKPGDVREFTDPLECTSGLRSNLEKYEKKENMDD